MKKLLTTLSLITTVIIGPIAPVAAEEVATAPPPAHIVIAAVQTGQIGATGNDFVEIYNPTNGPIDVTGWKLQYRAASSTGTTAWTTKRSVSCANSDGSPCQVVLLAKTSLLFATYTFAGIKTQSMSSGMSDVGGQIRFVTANASVQDTLGYGTAAEAEGGKQAVAPQLGQALLRRVVAGEVVDSDNNNQDFITGCYQPIPQGEIMPMQPPTAIACPDTDTPDDISTPIASTDPSQPADPTSTNDQIATSADENSTTYAPLVISELFPDPASPQTDSDDEFIELYNPTAETVSAEGYVLESGADFRYHFTIGSDITIAPGGYAAITSANSHLSLTNSGTGVRLLNPAGQVISEASSYGQAKSGQAWANVNGAWQWTTQPTPGASNILSVPAVAPATTSKKTATKTKTTTAKTATAKVPKTTASASKTAAKTAASTQPPLPDEQNANSELQGYLLLIPIGLIAVGYIVYEYRKDIAKLYRRLTGSLAGKKEPKEPTLQMD
jgi:hypothetical protein